MQVFEYQFNPNLDKDIKLKVFSFKPDNPAKAYLGELHIVIEQINYLPSDANLLEELTNVIKNEFYAHSKRIPEISLKEALRQANILLAKKADAGNVSWLGNLNIAILNLGNFFLNFANTGHIRIILLRGNEITDIGQDIESHNIGLPAKFFANISSGRLAPNDRIMVLTQQLFEKFYDEVLPEIINLSGINDKNLKRIFNQRRQEIKNWSGIFLLALARKDAMSFFLSWRFPKVNKIILFLALLAILLLTAFFIFK